MSKRNFILLIIILILAVIAFFGFLYLNPGTPVPGTSNNPGINFISKFNPFGNNKPAPTNTTPPVDNGGNTNNPVTEIPKLVKISSMPVAGFTIFTKERLKDVPITPIVIPSTTGTGDTTQNPPATSAPIVVNNKPAVKPTPPPTEFAPALRYVDKALGFIYQTFADKIAETKISKTTIPMVYDAYFGNNGDSVVMRYLKGDSNIIETFLGTIPKELLGGDTATGNDEIKGTFLPENIKDISISPDASKIFYLFINGGISSSSMIGTTLNLKDNKKVQVFDSLFTEWLSHWSNTNTITLTTKPSSNVPGYMYSVNLNNKNLTRILSNISGLTTLASPDGRMILYGDSNLSLFVYHTDTGNTDVLGVRTLPEKCVWSKASDIIYCAVPKSIDIGQYPDTWYQGEVSFNDQLWKIGVKSGTQNMLADPVTFGSGEGIDAIKLATDEKENYLFFVNKKDSFLWKLDLK
jgi:hypothetical protein